ncbi:MAG: hypothetical protein ACFFFY_09575 [Promethearchaeota archaeon]
MKWKLFKTTYPFICTKCGKLSNTEREYCESCGAKDSFRKSSKNDYDAYEDDKK